MREATLCFLVKGKPPETVLLGLKKAGFGVGKFAGIGGKVEMRETAVQTVVRELNEEVAVGANSSDLHKTADLAFLFPHQPDWSQRVHVFFLERWTGAPQESAEMRPHWFATKQIPFNQMWQDGRHWLPLVLKGQYVQAVFTFATDNETVAASEIESWPIPIEGK